MHKKIIIVIVTILLLLGGLFLLLKKQTTITNYPPEGETIIAFGDSLVAGVGAITGNDFPSVLQTLVGEQIINMGVSGNTTAQGLARVGEIITEDPKIVLVLLGGNDFLQKVPVEDTFKNIDAIVLKLQESGAVVILLGIQGGVLTDQYKEHFKAIAKTRGTLYVPNVLDGLIGTREYMSDAIHPNDAGYKKIAEKIYPILKEVLK